MMGMMQWLRRVAPAALVLAGWVGGLQAGEPLVTPDSKLAIVGDSITEQKMYSKFIESYVLATAGLKNVSVFQYGWGGERAPNFLNRCEADLKVFNPTVVTTCYGMNDGSYQPINDGIKKTYHDATKSYVEKLQKIGVKSIVLSTPGCVDTKSFRPGAKFADGQLAPISYNQNLKALGEIDRSLATEMKAHFADMHAILADTMAKAKAEKGEGYLVCGPDGVHPGPNGHLVMAYALLKALGFDGEVGTITVDLGGKATASAGHKILKAENGKIEVESEKYPFNLSDGAKNDSSAASILPYLPFNQDLNRFTLKVTNLGAEKGKVTWGKESKEFTKAQLEAGINLADEFLSNPFDGPFNKLMNTVWQKQRFETDTVKVFLMHARLANDPKFSEPLTKLVQDRWEKLNADVHAVLVPVKHTITIEAVK